MNIFFTDECPIKCAKHLDDKRVVKMVLETTQLLSTAINELGGQGPYKSTHVNHPCSKWARNSDHNYIWLLKHLVALCNEYRSRYGKTHKCSQYIMQLTNDKPKFKIIGMTPRPNCTGEYAEMEDLYTAYKFYLNDKWSNDKRTPTWYGKKA